MSRTARPTNDQNGSLDGDDAPVLPSGEKQKRGFPAPVTILTLVLILVWVAAFFIPSGQYELDASGSPIVGSYRSVPPPLDLGGRIQDLLLAPVNGMYGIQDPATGQVGPFNKGTMFGSTEVFPRARTAADRGPQRAWRTWLDQGLERRDPGPLRHDGSADDLARLRPNGNGGGRYGGPVCGRAWVDDQSVCHRYRVLEGWRQHRRWYRNCACCCSR
jgi:hypothetical protein